MFGLFAMLGVFLRL